MAISLKIVGYDELTGYPIFKEPAEEEKYEKYLEEMQDSKTLNEHDKQTVEKFIKAYTEFLTNGEKCKIYKELSDSPIGCNHHYDTCVECFAEKWKSEKERENNDKRRTN